MSYVHTTVNEMSRVYLATERRYNYTTPKTFLEQIKLYQNLLTKKRTELVAKIERLENGLMKLRNTASQVGKTSGSGTLSRVCETKYGEHIPCLGEMSTLKPDRGHGLNPQNRFGPPGNAVAVVGGLCGRCRTRGHARPTPCPVGSGGGMSAAILCFTWGCSLGFPLGF